MKAAHFFKEVLDLVDSLVTNHLVILGDFKIHWNCQSNVYTKQLDGILRFVNIRQQMRVRTQIHGRILDVVISRDDDYLIKGVFGSSMLYDHFLISTDVSHEASTKLTGLVNFQFESSCGRVQLLG